MMKQKILNNGIMLLAMVSIYFTSCKKSESNYYDYTNTVQRFQGSALDYLKSKPNTFDSLLLVLDRFPDLKDSIANKPITLFAPVNENFAASVKYLNISRKAAGKTPVYLSNADPAALLYMLSKYIVRGDKDSESYANNIDGVILTTVLLDRPMHVRVVKSNASGWMGGGAITLEYSDMYSSAIKLDWVTTKTAAINIKTDNATINILSPLESFGFDEFTTKLDL